MGMGKGRTATGTAPLHGFLINAIQCLAFSSLGTAPLFSAPLINRIYSVRIYSVSVQSAQFLFTAYLVLPEVPAAKN